MNKNYMLVVKKCSRTLVQLKTWECANGICSDVAVPSL